MKGKRFSTVKKIAGLVLVFMFCATFILPVATRADETPQLPSSQSEEVSAPSLDDSSNSVETTPDSESSAASTSSSTSPSSSTAPSSSSSSSSADSTEVESGPSSVSPGDIDSTTSSSEESTAIPPEVDAPMAAPLGAPVVPFSSPVISNVRFSKPGTSYVKTGNGIMLFFEADMLLDISKLYIEIAGCRVGNIAYGSYGASYGAYLGLPATAPDGPASILIQYNGLSTGVSSTSDNSIVIVDNTSPTITVKTGAGETTGTDPYFSKVSFKLYDEYVIASAKINGVPFTLTPNQWSDINNISIGNAGATYGINTLEVTDSAGNIAVYTFYLDNKCPTITVKTGASETTGTEPYFSKVSFKLYDEYKIAGVELNGTYFALSPNTWSDFNNVSVGSHGGAAVYGKNTLVAIDLAGNRTTYEFYLDNKGPTITVKTGVSETTGTEPYFSKVSFKLYDEYKIARVELNGTPFALSPNTWSDFNSVSVGSHGGVAVYGKNTLVAIDLAGNRTTYEFYLDNKGPTITVKTGVSETTGTEPYFSKVSFKLYDEYKIAGVELNDTYFALSPNTWSDFNNVSVGSHGGAAIYGKNTLVAIDLAGNRTTYEFYLDNVAPVMTIVGPASITLEVNRDVYVEQGVTVSDDFDVWNAPIGPVYIHYTDENGIFKGKVPSVDHTKLGTYKVVYKVIDSAGNIGIDANRHDHDYIIRVVTVVDTTPPLLQLNGSANITLNEGNVYTEEYATVTDNYDPTNSALAPDYIHYRDANGVFIGKVPFVDTSKPGEYKIVYTAKDSSGNIAIDKYRYENGYSKHEYVIRVVTVVAAPTDNSGGGNETDNSGSNTDNNSGSGGGGDTTTTTPQTTTPAPTGTTNSLAASTSSGGASSSNEYLEVTAPSAPSVAPITNATNTPQTEIANNPSPLAGPSGVANKQWSLLNLILTIAAVGLCVATWLLGSNKIFKVLGLGIAAVSILLLLFTQDFTAPVRFADS